MKVLYDIDKFCPTDNIILALKGYAILDNKNLYIKMKRTTSSKIDFRTQTTDMLSDIAPMKLQTNK
jgi:hypothetical protein